MKFFISDTFTNGSGQKFRTKEDFLRELGFMIDDCIANGGTFFDVTDEALWGFYISGSSA